jgi:hypothetical protein
MTKNITFIFILGSLLSCKKFVDIDPPADMLTVENVFANDTKATTSVNAIYGSMINSSGFSSYFTSLFGALSADELIRYNPDAEFEQINSNEITPNNALISSLWSSPYKHIYYANAALKGLQNSQTLSTSVKNKLIAECRFIRAFCYFYLVNFFGNVPLITGTDYLENATIPSVDKSQVYQFIKTELMGIRALLPPTVSPAEKVRPDKWTATAFLARINLYMEDWSSAETLTTEIINSGLYTPLTALNAVFLKTSKEAIWQLMPSSGQLQETQQFKPNGTVPKNYMTQQLLNQFQPGDQRKYKWMDSITSNSVRYYYPGKYKNTSSGTISEYLVVFRIAEQFLIRAEARLKMGNLSGAIDDLNILRIRAGLGSLAANLNEVQVTEAIAQERRSELFCEWGHRWFDLNRTGKANTVIGPIKPKWQLTDQLYPIPLEEILNNPNLVQNPGY